MDYWVSPVEGGQIDSSISWHKEDQRAMKRLRRAYSVWKDTVFGAAAGATVLGGLVVTGMIAVNTLYALIGGIGGFIAFMVFHVSMVVIEIILLDHEKLSGKWRL